MSPIRSYICRPRRSVSVPLAGGAVLCRQRVEQAPAADARADRSRARAACPAKGDRRIRIWILKWHRLLAGNRGRRVPTRAPGPSRAVKEKSRLEYPEHAISGLRALSAISAELSQLGFSRSTPWSRNVGTVRKTR